MPLVISLKPGSDFYVDDVRFVVTHIENANKFWIQKDGDPKPIMITDDEAVEIVPEVKASAGDYLMFQMIRLVLDAPRRIKIIRGEMLRQKGDRHASPGVV